MSKEETTIDGRDVWFFDDTETLRKEWSSANFESVGELLIDFFRYYSHDFQYNNTVISIRAGHLTKESKGWMNDIDVGGLNENARDRNRLCIEDPFETPYNVARTVTKDGLYTHRDQRDRAVLALAELCMEREDELARAPRSSSPAPRSLGGGSRSGGGGFGMTGSGAGGGGWKAHMGGGGGGAPSSYDRMSSPSGGAVAAGPAGAAGMMSPNTTTTTTGPPEADDFGRRSFSHAGTKRGRQPESAAAADRHYSAQERWLAQAGLGLDGHMGAGGGGAGGMAAGGAGGYMFGLRGMGGMQDRGRDTGGGGVVVPGGSRPQPPPLDVYGIPPAARRMSGMTAGGAGHHDGSGGSSSSVHHASSGPLGSASAPISPVKQGAPLPDAHRGSSGTWSANVSPRHAHQARLPPVMDPRGPSGGGGGLQGRRVSGNAGRGAILPAGNGFDARPPQAGASSNGYGRYASPSTTSSFNHANTNNNINNGNNTTGAARRAYSVGPAQNLNYGGAQGPIPGQDSAYAVYGGGNNPQAAANNGTSPLPAFLPFGAGPSQFKSTGNGNPMYGMSPPSFISPTSLLSPESRSTPLEPYPNMYHMKGDTSAPPGAGHVGAIGTRQVATPSAPPQPHNPDRGADDNEALDALASGLKQVALGLDAGEQQTAQQQQQQSNVSATQPSSSSSSSSSSAFANMPASAGTTGSSPGNSVANIPPPRKSSA
ncbi:hypothetical protein QFC19_001232 [Naganishia cerealis]|uniref:Uncharacterized protein n=1 Tax=Naganishia cerealis TaxID=610337 RepID=A0ACC2WJ13_9TREE|nr:hypothetical protein QFC19_001232 [Naganishia cerealis]